VTRSSADGRVARWPIVVILCLTGLLYFRGFGDTPIYLGGDEARFGSDAYAIASTGRSVTGDRMPLFFHLSDTQRANEGGDRWYQPMLFYLIALVLKVVPLSESSIRIPTAVIGIVDVLLIYLVAARLLPNGFYPALAALMLALSPAHFIFSRQALDYICPLPFVLGWLLCLVVFLETGKPWLLLAAGALLGVGFYSYIAAWVMMPLYVLLTVMAQRLSRHGSLRTSLAAVLGFALPLLIVVPWLWAHPEMLRDTIGRYKVYDARHLSPLQGVKDFLNYNNVQERVSIFWDYFNPAYLFFAGGSNLTTSTRKVGVFLLPVSLFLVAGIYDLWRRHSAIDVVLLAGLALAPIPAVLVDERYAAQRELFVLPFGVLIAVSGVALLLRQRQPVVRLATVLLLFAMPIQYASFHRDYFTDYRVRSASWFDPVNFRGVAEYVIANAASTNIPAIYLSRDLDDGAARWGFYLVKHRREDLSQRTSYFAAESLDLDRVPAGSLLVLYANDPKLPGLLGAEKCSVANIVSDAAGGKAAVILRKNESPRT
jgi:4-amino-4-deoxy-L-arabinose transferase-like glycosyltransferase